MSEKDRNNYQKVEEIIKDIDNKYTYAQNSNIFFCIDCNGCFSSNESKEHSDHMLLKIENNDIDNDINDLDYNANLKKIYENLKKVQNKILKYGNNKLIAYYGNLLFFLYEIIINNNSIEELNESIIAINDDYIKEIQNEAYNQFFKDYFLFNVKRIEKLSYFKKLKIEQLLADLEEVNATYENDIIYKGEEENNNNYNIEKINNIENNYDIKTDNILAIEKINNFENNKKDIENFNEDDKKKLFLKIGLLLKFNYRKNESITDLYSTARNEGVKPLNYEDYIMKELNIKKELD